jgi:acyl-CoA synthetase (AMP-forming)/AMP-acid ligase II
MNDSRSSVRSAGWFATPTEARHLPWPSPVHGLRWRALEQPDRLAVAAVPQLAGVTRRLSYRELDHAARAVAAALQAAGAEGERALIILDNDPDYLVAFLGCLYAGVVAVTLHTPLHRRHAERIQHVARDAEARFVLSSSATAGRLRGSLAEGVELSWVLVDEVPGSLAASWRERRPAASDLAFLQYTSGSTTTPRGVMITHGNLVYQAEYIARLFQLDERDCALSWLPLFHDMGLILGALQPLHSGFPLYLSTPAAFIKNPDRWLRSISQLGVTFCAAPDFAYRLCADLVDPAQLEGVDLSRWSTSVNAAEPVRADTIDRFLARFAPLGLRAGTLRSAYGLAEAVLAVLASPRGETPARRAVDSVRLGAGEIRPPSSPARARTLVASGRFLPDTVVRIVDPATRADVGRERVGEIWVGSTGLAPGYWRQPEATEEVFGATIAGEDGAYLRTGDLGFLDADGNVFVNGRLKDVIIINGSNHYPNDIEQTVELACDALRPHCTVAFSLDDGARERLVVVAEVRRASSGDLDPVAHARLVARRVLAEHSVPLDEVIFLEQGQTPKTTSGKVQRSLCRARWLAGDLVVRAHVTHEEIAGR